MSPPMPITGGSMSNPKVRVLKGGKWATNPPFDDHLILKKGETREDIEEKHIVGLVKYGYVKLVTSAKDKLVEALCSVEPTLVRAELCTIADNASNKNEAKGKLEEWGLENLDFNVNKSLKLETVIDSLVTEWENQNP